MVNLLSKLVSTQRAKEGKAFDGIVRDSTDSVVWDVESASTIMKTQKCGRNTQKLDQLSQLYNIFRY